MKWTTEPPKEPGWYWFRDDTGAKTIVWVYTRLGCLVCEIDAGLPFDVEEADYNPRWAGPIPEPEEDHES